MTTNFPSSVDAFTNPTSGDTLDNPPHDQQHANINDAMEAVQTSLLDGSPLKIDDANNRVGIGTTSPSTALEVSDVSPATITLKSENTIVTAGAEVQAIDFYQSDASGGAGVSARIVGVGNNSSGAQNLTFHTGQAGASSVAERVRIDSSGNVGINDTTPSYKLDVNGDINATGDLRIGGTAVGAYTDYSSSQTFSGFTKGNATIISRYCKINKFVHFWGSAVLGTTSSLSGPLDVFLPFSAVGNTLSTNSSCSAYDTSANRLYWGTALHIGTSVIRLVAHNSTSTYAYNSDIGTNVPFTWATGDIFVWNHVYEAS